MEKASLLKIAFLVVLVGSAFCDIASTKTKANQWRKHHPRGHHHHHHKGPAPAAQPPAAQPPASQPPLIEPPPPSSQPPEVETPPLVEPDAPSPMTFPPPYWQLSPYQPHGCGYPCMDSNDCDWPCTSCCDNSTCCDDQTSFWPIPPHSHDLNQIRPDWSIQP